MISYYWNKGPDGRAGEIPGIWIDDYGLNKELPAIEKSHQIKLEYLGGYDKESGKKLQESEITINWLVDGKFKITARCYVNDKRLKKQYQDNPEMAEKIVNFLVSCARFTVKEQKILKIGEILKESEAPEYLKQFIEQLKIWDEFIDKFWQSGGNFNLRYGAAIEDGYYIFVLLRYNLPMKDDEIEICGPLFYFDPQKEPPQIEKNFIYWNLEDKKIRLVLPYTEADRKITDYYGYTEICEQYLDEQKQEREKREKRQDEWLDFLEKEKQGETEKLKNFLMS